MAFKVNLRKNGDSTTTICNNEFVITVTYQDGEYLLSTLHIKDKTNKTIYETVKKHVNEFLTWVLKCDK